MKIAFKSLIVLHNDKKNIKLLLVFENSEGIASVLVSCSVFILLSHVHFSWLQILGRRTMTYFALHQEIVLVIKDLINHKMPQIHLLLLVIATEMITMATTLLICFAIDSIIRKSSFKFVVAG